MSVRAISWRLCDRQSKQEKVGRKMWVEWQGEAEGQKVGVEQEQRRE